MFDSRIRQWMDPPLRRAGSALARHVSADVLTAAACVAGLAAAVCAALGAFGAGLALFAAGRVLDGLDGAVARATQRTDRGGFLDIVLDFIVYAAIPLGFALHAPVDNALAASAALAAIVLNGSAFLAYAIMAERRGETIAAQGEKSLYYLAGIAEGGETIVIYVLFFVLPHAFAWLAIGFAGLCLVSGCARIAMAWRTLG